jgi:2-methylcitrate dehydratase
MMDVSGDRITQAIVSFIEESWRRGLTPAQERNLVPRVIDALACGLHAAKERDVDLIAKAVDPFDGAPRCSVLLRGKASLDHAAFLNGLMIHYLDWNDTYVGRNGGHPSDLIALALAAGEWSGKSGREVLCAIGIGTHLMLDFCDAADALVRGWDPATYTGIAAAAVAGLLLDLTPAQLAHAISLTAVSGNVLLGRTGRVAHWKNLASPHGVGNALRAVVLARAGMTGPDPVFEGEYGFVRHISGPLELELDAARDRSGDTFLKPYAAVYHAQGPIELCLNLREEMTAAFGMPDIAPLIESMDVSIYAFAIRWAADGPAKWRPPTRETADHSIPFLAALVLGWGAFDHEELDRWIRDERVLALTAKVRVEADPAFSDQWPRRAPARVVVRAGGRAFGAEIAAPLGHAARPMSEEQVVSKFHAGASKTLGPAGAGLWAERLRRFASLPTLAGLLDP